MSCSDTGPVLPLPRLLQRFAFFCCLLLICLGGVDPTQADQPTQETQDQETQDLVRILGRHAQWMTYEARVVLGPTRVPNVEVRLYKDRETYAQAVRRFDFAPRDSAGFYDGPTKTIHSYRQENATRVLLHEHAHALTAVRFADLNFRRYTKRGWPVWFEEGLAEWMSTVLIHRDGTDVRLDRDDPTPFNHLTRPDGSLSLPVPLSRLLYLNHKRFRGPQSTELYAMSLAVVQTVLNHPRAARSMVERLSSGHPPTEVVRRLVQDLGGVATMERMVRNEIQQSRSRTWRETKIYGHPDDTIWNWIPSGPGVMKLDLRIQLIQPKEAPSSTLFSRPIPRTNHLRMTTSCKLGAGEGSILLIGQDDAGGRRHLELRFGASGITIFEMTGTTERVGGTHHVAIPKDERELSIDVRGDGRNVRFKFNGRDEVRLISGLRSFVGIGLAVHSGKLDCSPLHVSGK